MIVASGWDFSLGISSEVNTMGPTKLVAMTCDVVRDLARQIFQRHDAGIVDDHVEIGYSSSILPTKR